MRPVSRVAMAAALTLSAASMLAHNLYELPLSPIDVENSGPIVFAALLGVAYALWPGSRVVAGGGAGLGRPEPRDRRDRHRAAAADPAVRARAVGDALRGARRLHPRAGAPRPGRLPARSAGPRPRRSRSMAEPTPDPDPGGIARRPGPGRRTARGAVAQPVRRRPVMAACRGGARAGSPPGGHHRARSRREHRSRASILPRRLRGGGRRGARGARRSRSRWTGWATRGAGTSASCSRPTWPDRCRTLVTLGTPIGAYGRSEQVLYRVMLAVYRIVGMVDYLANGICDALAVGEDALERSGGGRAGARWPAHDGAAGTRQRDAVDLAAGART